MSSVISLPKSNLACVSHVSVQISEYSPDNGGSDRRTGKVFAVETLFRDGTWNNEGYFRVLAVAKVKAKEVARARGAILLDQSIWPNRQIGGAQ